MSSRTCGSMSQPFPDFAYAVGEETSDPIVTKAGQPHRVDELAQSGHLERQHQDLADLARLGVRTIRYGMPWRLSEPSPGRYDWTLWDRALNACERHGLEPIVDLCHFGLPDHVAGFCDPAWVEAFLRYVEAFLSRDPDPLWFTPVNEPLTTALMSGRYGAWNDQRSTDADFTLALSHCAAAHLEAHAMIRSDRDGWSIGAEALTVPTRPPSRPSSTLPRPRAGHVGPPPRPEPGPPRRTGLRPGARQNQGPHLNVGHGRTRHRRS